MRSKVKDLKDAPGWKGNVFYPDGPDGNGFGIEILPDGRVWFPRLKADNDKVQKASPETCQPSQETVFTTNETFFSLDLHNMNELNRK